MGQEQLSQNGGAHGDDAVAFLPAGSAGIDGFPNAEKTVSQSSSGTLDRLLDFHAAAADRAGFRGLSNAPENTLETVRLLATVRAERSDGGS